MTTINPNQSKAGHYPEMVENSGYFAPLPDETIGRVFSLLPIIDQVHGLKLNRHIRQSLIDWLPSHHLTAAQVNELMHSLPFICSAYDRTFWYHRIRSLTIDIKTISLIQKQFIRNCERLEHLSLVNCAVRYSTDTNNEVLPIDGEIAKELFGDRDIPLETLFHSFESSTFKMNELLMTSTIGPLLGLAKKIIFAHPPEIYEGDVRENIRYKEMKSALNFMDGLAGEEGKKVLEAIEIEDPLNPITAENQFQLGNWLKKPKICIRNGADLQTIHKTPDYEQAVKWYAQAASKGHLEAMSKLGYAYMQGYDIDQDWNAGLGLAEYAFVAGCKDGLSKTVTYMNGVLEGLEITQKDGKKYERFTKVKTLDDLGKFMKKAHGILEII